MDASFDFVRRIVPETSTSFMVPAAGGGNFTFISKAEGTGASDAITAAMDTTGANLLVVFTASFGVVTGITDSKGNSWTGLTEANSGVQARARIWYSVPSSVGSGHTFTADGGSIFGFISAVAFSGAHALPFDVESTNSSGAGATSGQPGSVTPSLNNSLLFTGVCPGAGTSISVGDGFTLADTENLVGGVNMSGGSGYLIQGGAAAINPTWSWTGSNDWAAVIAAFKPI